MPLSAGTRLGSYEILANLGAGGMGEVYRARDTTLGREVAIKTLPSEFAKEPDRLARFSREAKLLAALNHPHIAVVYGLDEHEGTKFLAMELVEGETLGRKLQGPLPVEDALRLALQIAEALEAAHDKGVVHRDLKPANIMVTRDGQVKVLDFGLAKAFSGDPSSTMLANSPALSLAMTQQGFILGTAGYMSPEQASGQATDQRADIWAFGVVLFEMLTGKPLFSGESVPHILADVLRTPPDWSRLPKNLHPRLKLLLERCLEKNARNRYHSIADVRVDIEKVLADPGAAAFQITASAWGAAPRWLWLAGGLAAVSVAAAAAWLLKPAPPAEPQPVVRFDFALNAGQSLRNLDRDVVAVSPDGTKIVYNTSDGLYLRAVDELDGRLIPGTQQDAMNPFFSPDGEWIGFFDLADGQLKKIRTSGGSAIALTAATNLLGASWHPDGSRIVFAQPPAGLFEVSANGGALVLLVAGPALINPQYLPNGALLFVRVLTADGRGEIAIRSPGGDERALFPGERAIYTRTGHLVVADRATAPTTVFARRFDPDTLELGGLVPVVENAAYRANKTHYAIAPSGTLAYVYGAPTDAVLGQPDLRLMLVGRDGSRRPLAAPPRPYRSPRVSPDGSRVAVEIVDAADAGTSSIWIYDLAGDTDIRRLTQVNEGDNLRPIWTPDGERITFMSDRDGPGSIYWQSADGGGSAERLTTAAEGTFHLPESWSLDGTLSFAVIKGQRFAGRNSWDLYTRKPDGETAVFYGLGGGTVWSSAFSPDGHWLAYASNEVSSAGVDFRVFVERYPKTGERYEIAVGGALNPVWSHDGTEIFYRRGFLDAPRVLNSVRILQTEPRFRFTTANSVAIESFLNHANYRDFDTLPDGSGWIMLTPANGSTADGAQPPPVAPDRIRVVLNWFQELERRAP